MTLSVLARRLAVCRLEPDAGVPAWATTGRLWSVTRTQDELSVICEEDRVPPEVRHEGGWRALKLHGPFELSEIGVLLPVVAALAGAEVSALAVATFDTDYVLVREERLPAARDALVGAGHTVLPEPQRSREG